ncbi:MAG: adenylate kinase [Caldilineales bacterium]|nr:adenylate kinase [Caldilineales bacterium]
MSIAERTFIVFLGPPGSGKGTQTRMLETTFGLPQVSTGDLFRYNLKHETDLGKLAKRYMDAGELVPDEVTIRMVEERLKQPDCGGGAILDGFPRNLQQATALDAILADEGGLDLVPMLEVSDEEVIQRLSGRRVCRTCGHLYHTEFSPPQQSGVCDLDGGELYQRDDDTLDTIQRRLYVYYKQTSPLIGYYFAKGLLVELDGSMPPDEVQTLLLQAFRDRGINPVA